MKNPILLVGLLLVILASCSKDTGTITMKYTKAHAVYGDISDLRNTPLVTEKRTIADPGKVFVGDQALLIGEEGEGIHVFDNSNPSNPINKLFLDIPFAREFFVEGNFVYVESHYDMLKIDISDMNYPNIVSRVEYAFSEPILNSQGEQVIGFTFERVSETFDLSDPLIKELDESDILYFDYANELIPPSAIPVSFAGNNNGSIGAVNRIAWMNDHVYAIGLNKMTVFEDAPSGLNYIQDFSAGWQMETIFPSDGFLFIGTRNSVTIFDASIPSNPEYVSEFWHATSCDPVYPYGGVAYVTLRTGDLANCPGDVNALVTLDISDPTVPTEIKEIEMISPYGMTIHEGKLYVAEGEHGMKIFDASNEFDISLLHFDESMAVYDVMPHPIYQDLILTTGPDGINQYQTSANTFDLTLISSILY